MMLYKIHFKRIYLLLMRRLMIVSHEKDVEVWINVKITVESSLTNNIQIKILNRSILPRFHLPCLCKNLIQT